MTVRELAKALSSLPEQFQELEVVHEEEGYSISIFGAEINYKDSPEKPLVMLTGSYIDTRPHVQRLF